MAIGMTTKREELEKKDTITPKTKAQLKFMRDKDREMVKGKFIFHEVPGGTLSFVYKAYKEDDVERYDLTDGQIYTLPLGVARHLNKNCWYPVHAYSQDETGKVSQKIGQKVRRCSFQSLEFIDIDDLTPVGGSGIVTVENVGPTEGV
jgi:hypothetical protein